MIFCHSVRLVLGLVFILSGFVKAIDPFGFALKTEAYLQEWNMIPAVTAGWIAVLLPAIELWLGVMLCLGVWKRWVSMGVATLMVGFTALTAWLTFYPYAGIQECGCFGDAVELSHEMSFYKNVVLLLFALCCVYYAWKKRKENTSKQSFLIAGYFVLFVIAIPLYSLLCLPPFDFLDFNRGTDLKGSPDFHVYNAGYKEVTDSVLSSSSLPLFAVVKNGELTKGEMDCLEPLRKLYRAGEIGLVTLGNCTIPAVGKYYTDAVTAKSLIRSNSGVVLLQDGVIRGKWKLSGFTASYFNKHKDIREIVESQTGVIFRFWISVFGAGVIGLFLAVPACKKK